MPGSVTQKTQEGGNNSKNQPTCVKLQKKLCKQQVAPMNLC